MIVVVHTESGSVYELDQAGWRVRRRAGTHAPTARQGADGTWRVLAERCVPVVGEPLLFVWSRAADLERCTVTTRVVAVSNPN